MRRLILALAVVIVASACSSTGSGCDPLDPGGPLPFHLYVSNQSFEVDPVDIMVFVDDLQVVCSDFEVQGQHNWILFELGLDPGHHQIRAVGNGGEALLEEEFGLEEEHWAVVDFWTEEPSEPGSFTFSIYEAPIGFA